MPKVSIIIPVYNGEQYIAETINSVLQQSFHDYEIIVIDDGSTDRTADVVRSFSQEIRYFHKSNGGPGSARNVGICNSRGTFIAFLDQDDLWLPNRLMEQVAYLENHSEVALVFADAFQCDRHGKISNTTHFSIAKPFQGSVFAQLYAKNFIPNLTILVRRTCFSELGLLDESGRMLISDDYHMWLRVAACHPVAYINKPLAVYRVHSGNYSGNKERIINDAFAALESIAQLLPQQVERLGVISLKRHAELHYILGRHYLNQAQILRAQQQFDASVQQYFWHVKSWIMKTLIVFFNLLQIVLGQKIARRFLARLLGTQLSGRNNQ